MNIIMKIFDKIFFMSETQTLSQETVDVLVLDLLKLHLPIVEVDEVEFLDLLKNSLSLNVSEKKRVIDAVPTLSQFQFDELKKVFLEEREKFKELAWEHPEDIKKLLSKQQSEWIQLGEVYENERKKTSQADEDRKKLEEFTKDLGL